ncbi:amino acid ABC transporter substrate-binding protein [Alteromonas sp. RW2A1]|uniref:amino acid ABC transporter substrate-binding protein n=1 Tax=Alteromonas sp. RW2A1 TaxID=1917158 RepID=UPI000AB1F7C3|nr:amino acid ABC transporter substrate-binding protein [Alteromonas sp. RW2A1]
MRLPGKALIVFSLLSFITALSDVSARQNSDESDIPRVHTQVRLPNIHPGRDAIYSYAKQLLFNALTVTEKEYGTFEFIISEQESPQQRQLRSLEHDMLDVTWSVTSKDREAYFQPIRIPIMAGLYGKRVLLIAGDDTRFSKNIDIDTLRNFRAALGYDWPDTAIFRHAQIPVLETNYRASFKMVADGFADMFPRSVMEVKEEMSNLELSRGLQLENNLVIAYPSPVFFFVRSDNQPLAKRITDGLLQLIETGSFQQLLLSQEGYQESLALMEGRTTINIDNPLLNEESRMALETFVPRLTRLKNTPEQESPDEQDSKQTKKEL